MTAKPRLLDCVGRLFVWLLNIDEIHIVAFLVAALVIVGPAILIVRFLAHERYVAGISIGLLWCSCMTTCVRDYRRRRLTWVSGSIIVFWFFTTIVICAILLSSKGIL